ncbi:hypothetical protein SASPL_148680 [Salvia splendens]|uniref:Protein kinase domain-containing protein n=1 Tax=Salvia splendens TaxID=180675 RepID=A0A8X8WAA4_SALSN|nr:hypothetical protein SASPL_148680 [Salvia splendens]
MTTATATTTAAVRPLIISLLALSLQTTSLSLRPEGDHLIQFKASLKDSSSLDPTWAAGIARGSASTAAIRPLENNSFYGPILEFNGLGSLKSLFLSGNGFSGEIPSGFFTHMGSLKKLELYTNNFSGKISGSLQLLDSLIEILLQRGNPCRGSSFLPLHLRGTLALVGSPSISHARLWPTHCLPSGRQSWWPVPPPNGWWWWCWWSRYSLKKKDKSDMFSMIGSDLSMHSHHENAVEVHAPSINRRTVWSSRRVGNYRENGSTKKSQSNHGKSSDLVMINEEKGVFGMSDLMKAAAEVLGNRGLGSSYKATMANYGTPVVAKRTRGMNKLNKDAFDVEIRRLGRIRHRNILPSLAYHYRKEEKLLVTEFVPKGSLLFVLNGDGGIAHAELDWATRLKIIKGIARATTSLS